jgi:hypothetical protein
MKKIFFIFVCILCAFSSGCFADTSKSKPDWKKDRFFHEEFFQRDYTLEHLAQNPSQRVKKIIISIWYLPKKAEIARKHFGFENDPDDKVMVSVYAKYIDLQDWYQQSMTCNNGANLNEYRCYADADGGELSVTLNSNNQLLLSGHSRMEKCGVIWEEVADKEKNATSSLENIKGKNEKFILSKINSFMSNTNITPHNCD